MENTGSREIFNSLIKKAGTICIVGHMGPDGDSAGSVLGVYNYIKNVKGAEFSEEKIVPYLDDLSDKFAFLNGFDRLCMDDSPDIKYDLAIVCDCASYERPGRFRKYYENAGTSFLIDHHYTNEGFCDYYVVKPELSSASEVCWELFEEQYIDKNVAECIYTGIVHDTGVFRYSCTSETTMQIAGKCMTYGIDYNLIIDDSFFSMSLDQKRALGYVLGKLETVFDGKLIYSTIDRKTMNEFGVNAKDMDGIIDQMRTTRGAVVAIFIYEKLEGGHKVSMRSNSDNVDVSRVALNFGGGGHRRAAGCNAGKDLKTDLKKIIEQLGEQINAL